MKQQYLFIRVCLLACLLVASLAAPAQSLFDPTHVYQLRNQRTGDVVEVGGSDRLAPGKFLNMWPYWGGANQQWRIEFLAPDRYRIINRNSNQVMSLPSPTSTSVSYQISQNSYTPGNSYQQWVITLSSTGSGYTIRNASATGRMVLYDNGYLVHSPYAGYAVWDIVDVSAATTGVFRIMNVNSDKALSANEDNSVTQLPMWYLANQEWTFSDKNSTGYISIINRNTNQVLEIGGGNWGQPGARANVWDAYGNDWQQWRLVSTDGNNTPLTVEQIFTTGITCKLLNRYSGLALEIGGGGDLTRDGLVANQWYDYNGLNQQWHIYIDSKYRSASPAAGTTVSAPALHTLTVYPNPASTTLHLTLPGNGEAFRVTITDARGHTVPVSHQQGKVDVSTLAPGLYILSAANGQKTFRQKFIKQ